jgi:RimJ/RimL family protein N-acetyltransferase
MVKDLVIDDLKTSDREGLLAIVASGTDYPYWYRKEQTNEAAVAEYIDWVADVAAGRSENVYKAVRLPEGRLVGCVYLDAFDRKTGEASLSYFLHNAYQGRGIGTKAVFSVVREAVASYGLKTLHATVHPKKITSLRLLLRLGFVVTGYVEGAPYLERDGTPAARVVLRASYERLLAALRAFAADFEP